MLRSEHVALAPKTTLGLGGPARHYVEARDVDAIAAALRWAEGRGLRAYILGGGSNLVIADSGVDGLVVDVKLAGVRFDGTRVTAAAGEPWDALVERCLARGLTGLECLSGIPGRVGATPIQNVGAYGHEIAETLSSVTVLDRRTLRTETLPSEACEFGYRDSKFKRDPDRYVVLEASFDLSDGPAAPPRYRGLQETLQSGATATEIREQVIALRRAKSMIVDAADPDSRSAGSFFTNPIVTPEIAARVEELSAADSRATGLNPTVPRWPMADGRIKLAAGWLIERAGMQKGMRRGGVGISRAHALALVHYGGGSTAELLSLADEIQIAVRDKFGVTLEREPVLWGARSSRTVV